MDTEVVSGSCEGITSLVSLPAELLVYIMSLLVIRDRINLRYVSRRLRCVSQVAVLWSEFVWPYFERRDEHYASDALKACGEHVQQLIFPVNMPSARIVWLTENCVNVRQLGLPTRTHIYPGQLERVVYAMTNLQKLDICWSENIKPLLEIGADLKELTIHIRKFKVDPPAWEIEEWASEGIRWPPVVKIFTQADFNAMENLYVLLSKCYSTLPDTHSKLFVYSNAKIPMNCHPLLPLVRCEFGLTATSPVVKASSYGILGHKDMMDILEFSYDGKIMYGIAPSLFSVPRDKHFILSLSTLSSVTFFIAGYHTGIYPGHLEQIAIACPNLRWLNLKGCGDCLQSLKGLQSIANMCQDLQGLNIVDISIEQVESFVLLWQVISSMAKLTHLSLGLCLLMVPVDYVHYRQKTINIFQTCHSLQALEVVYGYCGDCTDWSIDDLLLSHFPSLAYCKLSYDNPNILQGIITTCKNLKYLCYDNWLNTTSLPSSCCCKLQQICIESKYTDITDSFIDMISLHGELEHVILSVRSINISGIYTLINNSPNLMSFCTFINQPLCNQNGRKVQSKDFKIKVKKEFCHHKLFIAGTFRLAVGNQFFYQCDVLIELNTDLSPLWDDLIFRI